MVSSRQRWRPGRSPARLIAVLATSAMILVGCTGGQSSDSSVPLNPTSSYSAGVAEPETEPSTSLSATSEPTRSETTSSSIAVSSTTLADPCESLVKSATTVDVAATKRSFELHLPTDLSPDRPAPLLVLLHGFNGQATTIASRTNLLTAAPNAGVVLAVPQGIGEPTTWHYDANNDFGDAEFLEALLDQLGASPCIDVGNIWLAGFSAGSGYTGIFGCSRAARFAGLLMVSGLAPPICPEKSGLELLIFHGVEDPIVAFDGGEQPVGGGSVELASIPESATGWAKQAGCGPTPTGRAYGDTNLSIVATWSECAQNANVTLVAIEGLGHTWPVSAPTAAPIVDASCAVLTAMTDPTRDPIESCFG